MQPGLGFPTLWVTVVTCLCCQTARICSKARTLQVHQLPAKAKPQKLKVKVAKRVPGSSAYTSSRWWFQPMPWPLAQVVTPICSWEPTQWPARQLRPWQGRWDHKVVVTGSIRLFGPWARLLPTGHWSLACWHRGIWTMTAEVFDFASCPIGPGN